MVKSMLQKSALVLSALVLVATLMPQSAFADNWNNRRQAYRAQARAYQNNYSPYGYGYYNANANNGRGCGYNSNRNNNWRWQANNRFQQYGRWNDNRFRRVSWR